MTSDDWWRIGSRLLGVYFLVGGALTATGSLMMMSVEFPEGTRRWVMVVTPVVQGIISAGAGGWLLRRSGPSSGSELLTGVSELLVAMPVTIAGKLNAVER